MNVFRSLDARDTLRVGVGSYLLACRRCARHVIAVAFGALRGAGGRRRLCTVVVVVAPPAITVPSTADGGGRGASYAGDGALLHLVIILAMFALVQRVLLVGELGRGLLPAGSNLLRGDRHHIHRDPVRRDRRWSGLAEGGRGGKDQCAGEKGCGGSKKRHGNCSWDRGITQQNAWEDTRRVDPGPCGSNANRGAVVSRRQRAEAAPHVRSTRLFAGAVCRGRLGLRGRFRQGATSQSL